MIKSVVSKLNTSVKSRKCLNQSISKYFASFDCNNCSKKTALPECTACHRMVNYFNIFNIPESYSVNEKAITTKAKQLQKQYHPDKHEFNQNLENFFKENMIKYSAYINEAKATLLDDLKRATYMMELRGIDIQDSKQIQDNKFMMEMFMLQEEIQDGSQDACQEIKERIQSIMKNLQEQFDSFFKSQDMKKCKEFVYKYKYLHRALQNVNQKLHAMEATHH